MNAILMLAAIGVIFVSGYGATRWLLKDAGRVWAIELPGYAWLIGTGIVSVILAVVGTFATGVALVGIVSVASITIGLIGWIASLRVPRPMLFPVETRMWELALTCLPLLPIAWLWVETFRQTLHWDGLLVWEIKARIAFENGGALPLSYFSASTLDFSHQSYPLYLPMLELWTYLWLGEANQFLLKAIFPFFYLSGACILWSAGLRLTGRVWIGAFAALLLLAIPRMVAPRGGVLQGYADFPLAVLYLASFVALLLSKKSGGGWMSIAAIASGLLPWVKQEGMVLWGCFAFVAVWLYRREWKTALRLVLPGIVTILSWRAFLYLSDASKETIFQPITLATTSANFPRLAPLLARVTEEFLKWRTWSLLWPLCATAMAILAYKRHKMAVPLALGTCVPLLVYLAPFYFTTFQPWEMHVETSIERLLLQLAPLAIVPLVLVLGDQGALNKQYADLKQD